MYFRNDGCSVVRSTIDTRESAMTFRSLFIFVTVLFGFSPSAFADADWNTCRLGNKPIAEIVDTCNRVIARDPEKKVSVFDYLAWHYHAAKQPNNAIETKLRQIALLKNKQPNGVYESEHLHLVFYYHAAKRWDDLITAFKQARAMHQAGSVAFAGHYNDMCRTAFKELGRAYSKESTDTCKEMP